MIFPTVLYRCESWTIEGSGLKNWCFRTVVVDKRSLRVPWTARKSNQSILKEINPEYSLEALMLKLKLQHFGHLMRRAYSLEKTLMLGKIKSKRRREQQRMKTVGEHHRFNGHELGQTPEDGEGQGSLVCYSPWVTKSWTSLGDWHFHRTLRHLLKLTSSITFWMPSFPPWKHFKCTVLEILILSCYIFELILNYFILAIRE